MKILVTGGAGFIGSHIVSALARRAEIVVLDNFKSGNPERLKHVNCRIVEGDVRDQTFVQKISEGCPWIIQLAALVKVAESMQYPMECFQINTLGTLQILEAARHHRIPKVIVASSAAIYGDSPVSPKTETQTPQPRSPYAISKLDGEYLCDLFRETFGVATAALRFFNVYGSGQDPNSDYAAVIPQFIQRALNHQNLVIYGEGSQTRDFIHVSDVARAIELVGDSATTGVFNLGYGQAVSIRQLAEKIIAFSGSNSTISYEPERSGDVKHSLANIAKIQAIGFQPHISLDEGLRQTLQAFRAQ
jgi:UDP-glucose 4-epimerase